jgi:hypothetical protein
MMARIREITPKITAPELSVFPSPPVFGGGGGGGLHLSTYSITAAVS